MQLLEGNCLKRRKLSSQVPQPRFDDEDKDFIAKAFEDKATILYFTLEKE